MTRLCATPAVSLVMSLALIPAACSAPSSNRSDTDASSEASDSGRSQPGRDAAAPDAAPAQEAGTPEAALCPGARVACENSVATRVLLDASSLGPNARLVAIDGGAVLSQVDAGAWVVLRPPKSDTDPVEPPTRSPLALGTLQGVDVLDTPSVALESNGSQWLDVLSVLACGGTSCSLFTGREGTELEKRSDLPTGYELGLSFDARMGRVCAFGSAGVACSDTGSTWTEGALLDTQGRKVRGVAFDAAMLLVVGDDGLLYYEVDDVKRMQAGLDEVDFVAAAATSLTMAALDSRGQYYRFANAEAGFLACGDEHVFAALAEPGMLVGELADVWHARRSMGATPSGFCVDPALEIGTVIGASEVPCGVVLNPWLLTDRLLVGGTFCAID